jgi:hypothetical protein
MEERVFQATTSTFGERLEFATMLAMVEIAPFTCDHFASDLLLNAVVEGPIAALIVVNIIAEEGIDGM